MADFKYVAVDAQGKTQSGELTAKDAKEARSPAQAKAYAAQTLIAGGTENSKRSARAPPRIHRPRPIVSETVRLFGAPKARRSDWSF